MKKVFLVSVLTLLMVGGVCQKMEGQTRYYVVSANLKKTGELTRPIVTTVMPVSCNFSRLQESDIKNQFMAFFRENYQRQTGFELRYDDIRVQNFDSENRAASQRSEWITEYNRNNRLYSSPQTTDRFRIRCED